MMLAVATTLAAVLVLPGAFAIPEHLDATATQHRALQQQAAADPNGDFAAQLRAATAVDANGEHHLWFRSTFLDWQRVDWCGEIDAAPYMPADIFQPENFLSLLAYAQLTIRTYVNPNDAATPLVLGDCSRIGFNVYNGVLFFGTDSNGVRQRSDVSWFGDGGTSYGKFGRMMGSVCAVQCACDFRGNGPGALPACIDSPDDPSSGRFCSLCGPSTACGSAGCNGDKEYGADGVARMIGPGHPIHIFNKGPARCQPRGSRCQLCPGPDCPPSAAGGH